MQELIEEYTLLYRLERGETDSIEIGKRSIYVRADGTKEWCLNGKLHREGGPAVEWADGTKEWWLNNRLHRENGPAIELVDGTKEWWLNNRLHRENGPAIELVDGTKE